MSTTSPLFIGLDTHYLNAEGERKQRIHLDGAASPLPMQTALTAVSELLPHYSNTHSHVHNSARVMTEALAWAEQQVLSFLAANPTDFTAVFAGAGTTAATNRLARGLHYSRTDKPVVLVSAMEHHANDLPHRQFGNEVHYLPLTGTGANQGAIDLLELENQLKTHADRVNYVAFSAVSNVTGVINPTPEICALAHRYGALVLVDAAQAVAHLKIELSTLAPESQPDFLIFSGHKVYCPMAPGVLVAKRDLLNNMTGQDLGGGAVNDVSYYDFELGGLPDREQAGTPNIVGAIALGRVLEELHSFGRQKIEDHARALMQELKDALSSLSHIRVYGAPDSARIGALSFTHDNIEHGLLAAILNDYAMIAVRNECFCAHPYVSSLLQEQLWQLDLGDVPLDLQEAFINRYRGMVRISLSLYNTSADIEKLIATLCDIDANIDQLRPLYSPQPDGNFIHQRYRISWRDELGWSE